MNRIIFLICTAALLTACSGSPSYNQTVYPFEFDRELFNSSSIKRVIIASINLGGATRSYLENSEDEVDKVVADYLAENGFRVAPQRRFQQQWKTAIRIYGDPVDPTSGRVNQKTFTLALINVRDVLRQSDNIDAIVFTDIIEKDISFSGGLKHLARWDGVSRKPSLQGPSDGVSSDFDWNRAAKGASLWVNIYTMDLKRVLSSMGGMDATEAIDTRSSSGDYVRRRNILENKNFIREGVELALHPMIDLGSQYPGNQ